MTKNEYKEVINYDMPGLRRDSQAARLIELLDQSEDLLFQGQDEVQPVKWHQFKRIYELARRFIEIIVIIWPHIRTLIRMLKFSH